MQAVTKACGKLWNGSACLGMARKRLLQDDAWWDTAQTNREELFAEGLWGVPSFKVDNTMIWGQDRLWAVHAALKTKVERIFYGTGRVTAR